MDRLAQLLRERAALITEAGEVLAAVPDGDNPTKEQNARLDAIDAQITDTLNPHIARLERQRELERLGARDDRALLDPIEPPKTPAAGNIVETPKPFRSFGEQLQAIAQFATRQVMHPGLAAIQAAATGASEGSPSDGGFLVQSDFATEIREGITAGGEIMSRVPMIPISGGANSLKMNAVDETSRVDGSRWGGVRAYWAAEAATLTASRPKFRQIALDLHKLTGLFYATDELLADAAALETIAMRGFTEELTFKAEDAIFEGDGSGKPLGILNAPGTISVAKETGQAAATLVYENITAMWNRMSPRNRANTAWFINQEVEPQLDNMFLAVGTGGVPVYMPANGVADSPFGRLKGRPVIPVEYASALGTAGDIVLADFSEYVAIEKGAPETASSMHVQFVTGEMTYRVIWRLDGQPYHASALTPFKGSTTTSPFVKLAARA